MGTEASLQAAARSLREMWENKAGEYLPPNWDAAFAKWIEKFGYPIVVDALQAVVARRYLDLSLGVEELADIHDVPSYAAVRFEEDREPGMEACYLIRGRMRKKYSGGDEAEMLEALVSAMRRGMRPSFMHAAVDDNETLEDCLAALGTRRSPLSDVAVAMRRGGKILVRESDPEWPLWVEYYRKTRGQSPPMNRQFGWYFPSRLPPADLPSKKRTRRR